MSKLQKQHNTKRGITLLVTLLTMGVLLSVAASLMFITLKQYQLSGIVYSSEIAFQAATAGVECALYHDLVQNQFDVAEVFPSGLNCFGGSPVDSEIENEGTDVIVDSGEEQRLRYSWSAPSGQTVCTEFSIYKFYDASSDVDVTVPGVIRDTSVPRDGIADPCPAGSECTVLQSRGYNTACNLIDSSTRVVEREYTQVY